MLIYKRKINYYETDKMGITHHSNYVRYMEEARIAYLDMVGWSFERLESEGYVSPVLGLSCKYENSTTFGDEISVCVRMKQAKGVRFSVEYEMTKVSDGTRVFYGESEHCFLDRSGRPVRLKKELPGLYAEMEKEMQEGKLPD